MIVTSLSNLCLFAEEFEGKPFGGGSPEVAEALRAEVNREFTEATAVQKGIGPRECVDACDATSLA